MILIISNESDLTTNEVINWLIFENKNFIRINDSSIVNFISSSITKNETEYVLEVDGEILKLSEITSCWYRRGAILFDPPLLTFAKNIKFKNQFNEYIKTEMIHIVRDIYFRLSELRSIGSVYHNETNKLNNLNIARKSGLDIPDTCIITKKDDAISFFDKHVQILTKAIIHGANFNFDGLEIAGMSSIYERKDLENIANEFFPTLFQECLIKRYELRIFYLAGKCYTSVIFSQNDEKTKTDFRNYNFEKPNRMQSFNLPSIISKKIDIFMKYVNMNSGSIDMVVTIDKRYVFLEVNPIGQFSQFSNPCNLYLEKAVAKYLINN